MIAVVYDAQPVETIAEWAESRTSSRKMRCRWLESLKEEYCAIDGEHNRPTESRREHNSFLFEGQDRRKREK
ncbi:MAG TPA: hypothetical protein ENH11_07985 [Candidatus Acetothermia bacterium]|nr:hypothetical protein [Candidatus Acetothermia bacterium]